MGLVARIIAAKGAEAREVVCYHDHYSFHDWVGEVFLANGGEPVQWEALDSLALEASDLDLLEAMVGAPRKPIGYSLRSTWVNSKYTSEAARQADLEVIRRCREAVSDGLALSYVFKW